MDINIIFTGYIQPTGKEIYMKKNESDISLRQKSLMDDIKKTRQALDTVYCNFQYVSDPDLIDCYIYEMNSVHLRYKYLMKQLQQLRITPR